jgi:hypothetical protein
VLIQSSTFSNNYAPFYNCTEFETIYDVPNLILPVSNFAMNTPFSPTSQVYLVYQQYSIIQVTKHTDSIIVKDCTFENNLATAGIINIQLAGNNLASNAYALIEGNTFNENGGFSSESSNVLRLSRTEGDLTLGASRALCGGFTVFNNIFTANYGCYMA